LLSRLAPDRRSLPGEVAVPICSVDAGGWPHPSLLSYDEIEAPEPSLLRVHLYGGSSTAANLRCDGHLTLLFIDERGVFYVKARARGGVRAASGIEIFDLDVSAVLADDVDTTREPDARITSGIRYRRVQPDTRP
jgi:hypothetical protein